MSIIQNSEITKVKKNSYIIAIIGAGQLGSRYLQGLKMSSIVKHIYVVDPNHEALVIARDRFNNILPKTSKIEISYNQRLENVPTHIDLAIICTNADVRIQVIKHLLSSTTIRYLILEKVAFQTIEDCRYSVKLLKKKKIEAWVNCPRRLHPIVIKLKDTMFAYTHRFIKVKGSKWGLACNAIHMLDLFSFLFGDQDIYVDISKLHPRIYHAKRNGFIEFGGMLTFKNSKGDLLCLNDKMKEDQKTTIDFGFDKKNLLTINNRNMSFSQYNNNNELMANGDFTMPLQSELTGPVVEEILTTGSCGLSPLDESMKLHIAMLKGFIDHLNIYSEMGGEQQYCPIT